MVDRFSANKSGWFNRAYFWYAVEWLVNALFRLIAWAGICLLLAALVAAIWQNFWREPPTAAELAARQERSASIERERQDERASKQYLCRAAAACKKYSEARLECATAGSFRTCLRIKMDVDASYSGICSGYEEGAAAVPLPRETPNAVACFFLLLGQ
jgi:hypothetical protein